MLLVTNTTLALVELLAAVSLSLVGTAWPGAVAHWSRLSAVLTTPVAALMIIPSATPVRALAVR